MKGDNVRLGQSGQSFMWVHPARGRLWHWATSLEVRGVIDGEIPGFVYGRFHGMRLSKACEGWTRLAEADIRHSMPEADVCKRCLVAYEKKLAGKARVQAIDKPAT